MTDDTYIPIDCGLHSEYELAIMHRIMLQLAWREETGQQRIGKVMPLDLKTDRHQEFLIAQTNDGELHRIRLDRIDRSDVTDAIRF